MFVPPDEQLYNHEGNTVQTIITIIMDPLRLIVQLAEY